MPSLWSPFLRPTSPSYADMLTDEAVSLLADRGLQGLTLRALAERLNVTCSAVAQRVGGKTAALEWIAAIFSRRWVGWVGAGPRLVVRLPENDDEIHGTRVWLALSELAAGALRAGEPRLAEILAHARRDELVFLRIGLRDFLGRTPTDLEVLATAALGDGLRADLASSEPRAIVEQAREIVRAHLSNLTASGDDAETKARD